MKGIFITFEGPDGAGKTTQIKMLKSFLDEQGISSILTREPGGTEISDYIREIILNPNHKNMQHETEILLYAASRAQHVREKIIPALNEGKVVLCDRFVDASVAYQGYGLGVDIDKIKSINAFAIGTLEPKRTYMIDLPPSQGRKRLLARIKESTNAGLDRIEQKESEYHESVRRGFDVIATNHPQRILKIDGSRTIEEVFEEIKKDFLRFWQNHN